MLLDAEDQPKGQAEEPPAPTEEWSAHQGCEWKLDENGILRIRPLDNGELGSIDNLSSAPWQQANNEVKTIEIEGTIVVGNAAFGLLNYENLEVIEGLNNFDTSEVTKMNNMFSGCHRLASLDLSNFNTSNVMDSRYMFDDALCEVTVGEKFTLQEKFPQ